MKISLLLTEDPPPSAAPEHGRSAVEESITVAVRVRPLMNERERIDGRSWTVRSESNCVVETTPDGNPLPNPIHQFTFDKTFGEECTTEEIYTSVAKSIVLSSCTGINGTIFAYGKTYTMQGSASIVDGWCAAGAGAGAGGILHLAAAQIYEYIAGMADDHVFSVRASCFEVYNEEVYDLLEENRSKLHIRTDAQGGPLVKAKEVTVIDANGLLEVLARGGSSRTVGSTAMNDRSSRSHTVFRITIESRLKQAAVNAGNGFAQQSDLDNDDSALRVSTLTLVDLAGTESVKHTDATGGMINQSLLALSRVMDALGKSSRPPFVGYRESKLTRLLQPSLSGNARIVVICFITSSKPYVEITRSTLKFAQSVKLVKTNPTVNFQPTDRVEIQGLRRELTKALEERMQLHQDLVSAQTANCNAEIEVKRLSDALDLCKSCHPCDNKENQFNENQLDVPLDDIVTTTRETETSHSTIEQTPSVESLQEQLALQECALFECQSSAVRDRLQLAKAVCKRGTHEASYKQNLHLVHSVNDDLSESNSQLRENVSALETQLSEMTEAKDALHVQVRCLTKDRDESNSQLSELHVQVRRLTNDRDITKQQLAFTEKQFRELSKLKGEGENTMSSESNVSEVEIALPHFD